MIPGASSMSIGASNMITRASEHLTEHVGSITVALQEGSGNINVIYEYVYVIAHSRTSIRVTRVNSVEISYILSPMMYTSWNFLPINRGVISPMAPHLIPHQAAWRVRQFQVGGVAPRDAPGAGGRREGRWRGVRAPRPRHPAGSPARRRGHVESSPCRHGCRFQSVQAHIDRGRSKCYSCKFEEYWVDCKDYRGGIKDYMYYRGDF